MPEKKAFWHDIEKTLRDEMKIIQQTKRPRAVASGLFLINFTSKVLQLLIVI